MLMLIRFVVASRLKPYRWQIYNYFKISSALLCLKKICHLMQTFAFKIFLLLTK